MNSGFKVYDHRLLYQNFIIFGQIEENTLRAKRAPADKDYGLK
jgi:hypothetical protein